MILHNYIGAGEIVALRSIPECNESGQPCGPHTPPTGRPGSQEGRRDNRREGEKDVKGTGLSKGKAMKAQGLR